MNKIIEKTNKKAKIFSIFSITAIVATFFILQATNCFADGEVSEATTMMSNFLNIIFTFVRFFGIFLAAWGVFDIGSSMSSHDSNQRSTGIKLLVGGIIIIFAKEILNAIGVTW